MKLPGSEASLGLVRRPPEDAPLPVPFGQESLDVLQTGVWIKPGHRGTEDAVVNLLHGDPWWKPLGGSPLGSHYEEKLCFHLKGIMTPVSHPLSLFALAARKLSQKNPSISHMYTGLPGMSFFKTNQYILLQLQR